jgi:hypothetical protein
MNPRDQVARLAKSDYLAALKIAKSIENLRGQIQSLGWVARYAPADQVASVIRIVTDLAQRNADTDYYGTAMAIAWPLRALHEAGQPKLIPPLLRVATNISERVTPESSGAVALSLIIQAVLPAGLSVAESAISKLAGRVKDQHWRTTRALTEVALMVNSVDHARALVIARAIAAENKRATAIRRLENAEASEPRAFFWG